MGGHRPRRIHNNYLFGRDRDEVRRAELAVRVEERPSRADNGQGMRVY